MGIKSRNRNGRKLARHLDLCELYDYADFQLWLDYTYTDETKEIICDREKKYFMIFWELRYSPDVFGTIEKFSHFCEKLYFNENDLRFARNLDSLGIFESYEDFSHFYDNWDYHKKLKLGYFISS